VPGGGGTYTVAELVPADDACIGTLNFSGPGPSFNLVVRRDGKKIWMIQTNPPSPATVMNIFEGTVTRLSPEVTSCPSTSGGSAGGPDPPVDR